MSNEAALPAENPPPMPLTAFFGTLALPGLGHVLVGCVRQGLLWFALYACGLSIVIGAVLLRAPLLVLYSGLIVGLGAQLGALVSSLFAGKRPGWQWGEWWSRGLIVLAAIATASGVVYKSNDIWKATLFEPFKISTNAMMPALIGESVWGHCTQCGERTPLHPDSPFDRGQRDDGSPAYWARGICTHCGAMLDDRAYDGPKSATRSPDRIFVGKQLTAHRWDIIAFRYPEDTREIYAKRLVGLPGERVEIRDGEITVNGSVIPKPDHLRSLKYLSLNLPGTAQWGEVGNAVTLGEDEYFVLGDFSACSKDSRFWEHGAPGHPPYAVPADYILGVVAEIYWPRERWRVFERGNPE